MIFVGNIIAWLYNMIGSLVCHQLPERTISASGIKLPMCARDTGIYLGVFIGAIFAILRGRMKADRPPSIFMAITLCLLMVPMMFDGIGSYIGMLQTGNTTRMITGALFGLSLIVFLLPVANYKVEGKNEYLLLKNHFELGLLILALMLICTAVLFEILPYMITGTIIVASLIFLLTRITFTIIALAFPAKRSSLYVRTIGAVLVVMTAMYLLSAYVLQPLKVFLLGRS
jgi:Predicted membrane protein